MAHECTHADNDVHKVMSPSLVTLSAQLRSPRTIRPKSAAVRSPLFVTTADTSLSK